MSTYDAMLQLLRQIAARNEEIAKLKAEIARLNQLLSGK